MWTIWLTDLTSTHAYVVKVMTKCHKNTKYSSHHFKINCIILINRIKHYKSIDVVNFCCTFAAFYTAKDIYIYLYFR